MQKIIHSSDAARAIRWLYAWRFNRLTNAFSKMVENHGSAVVLYFMYYNVGRFDQTLHVTPAMEARVANHVWSVEEIVGLLV